MSDDVKQDSPTVIANDPSLDPLRAAKGDDDLMSQGAPALPGMDELKARWKQQVGAAKLAWGKLTDDELLQIEGRAERLAGMVQERYAITRHAAEHQVKDFFDKFKH